MIDLSVRHSPERVNMMDTKCEKCGKEMGFEAFLGPICGACVRKAHRKATR